MLNGSVDLHLHTTCSDGLDTPEELVDVAVERGYRYISITDHDTVEGVVRGIEAAKGKPIELIPGIELSSMQGDDDIHILGYYFDYTIPEFVERIAFFKERRGDRAEAIVQALNSLGLDINIETVLTIAHGAPLGRPHIAAALLSEELVDTYNEAFDRYIGAHGPAYVPKYEISPREAIELIRSSGGIPVLAHPGVIDRDDSIEEMVDYGLMGIECIHPLHTQSMRRRYERLAGKYSLICTGGSDWHGRERSRNPNRFRSLGSVPEETIGQMKSLIAGRQQRG